MLKAFTIPYKVSLNRNFKVYGEGFDKEDENEKEKGAIRAVSGQTLNSVVPTQASVGATTGVGAVRRRSLAPICLISSSTR